MLVPDVLGFREEQEVKGGMEEVGHFLLHVTGQPVNIDVADPQRRLCV